MQLNFQSLLVLIYSREGCSVSAHSSRGGGSEGGGGGHTSIQMFSFPPRFHFPSWNRLPSSRILFKALSYPGVRILQLPLFARTDFKLFLFRIFVLWEFEIIFGNKGIG